MAGRHGCRRGDGGEPLRRYADVFKALADSTRLRILHLLVTAGDSVCVCELADALGLPQYVVSKHLGVLRQAGLVTDARVGTWVHYSPLGGATPWVRRLYDLVAEIVDPTAGRDRERLAVRLSLRQGGQCVVGPQDPRVELVFARAGLATRDEELARPQGNGSVRTHSQREARLRADAQE